MMMTTTRAAGSSFDTLAPAPAAALAPNAPTVLTDDEIACVSGGISEGAIIGAAGAVIWAAGVGIAVATAPTGVGVVAGAFLAGVGGSMMIGSYYLDPPSASTTKKSN